MEDNSNTMVFTNPRHGKRIITANWEIIISPGEQEIIVRARGKRLGGRHQRLVEALVSQLLRQGYKVRADGVNVPEDRRLNITLTVGRSRIDVIAFDGVKYQYYEVKTLPELATDHTRKQLIGYSKELEEFYLVVPPEAENRAKDLIRLLGLREKCRLMVIHDLGRGNGARIENVKVEPDEIEIYFKDIKPEW